MASVIDKNVKTKNITPNITKSIGFRMLQNCEKTNLKVGSIILMKKLRMDMFSKINDFQKEPTSENAREMAAYCLKVRDQTLPLMVKDRYLMKDSRELYDNLRYACGYLLDDFQTWWDVSIN